MERNMVTLNELTWRREVYFLFHRTRPLIAKFFDFPKCEHYYHDGYSPGETVIFILNEMGVHVSEEDYFDLWGK